MKKLLFTISLMVSTSFLFANAGIYETYLSFSVDGGGQFYLGTGGGNNAFAGYNLATNLNPNTQTLIMKLRGINTFQDNSSVVNSASMSYRVYKSGSIAPSFITITLPNQGASGNNQFWNMNAPDINLLAGVSSIGTYNVEIQFDAATNGVNCTNPISANARLLGSIATFTTNTVLSNELTSFNAVKQNNKVNLSWLTATEKANETFSIERSKDGRDFTQIGLVKGAINSNTSKDYFYIDENPLKGINYYRLKSNEIGGKVNFSKVVSMSLFDKYNKTIVFPNPVSESVLRLEHEAVAEGDLQIKLIDLTGRIVQSEKRSVVNGSNIINLNVNNLSSGQYIVVFDEQLVRFIKN
jgi:Secretion system C-terminal sorting domain